MNDTAIHVNEYSSEHGTRRALREAANRAGFVVEKYALTDTKAKRTLAMRLEGRGDEGEPPVLAAIREALRQNGYEPGTNFRLTITATKEIGDQMRLNLNTDPGSHPDNV